MRERKFKVCNQSNAKNSNLFEYKKSVAHQNVAALLAKRVNKRSIQASLPFVA